MYENSKRFRTANSDKKIDGLSVHAFFRHNVTIKFYFRKDNIHNSFFFEKKSPIAHFRTLSEMNNSMCISFSLTIVLLENCCFLSNPPNTAVSFIIIVYGVGAMFTRTFYLGARCSRFGNCTASSCRNTYRFFYDALAGNHVQR